MDDKEKNILAFITKMNDRNIQRQRENGFTLYAILGGIIYVLIYLVDNANVLFNKTEWFTDNFILFVTLLNFSPGIFFVWYLFKIIFYEEDDDSLEILPRLSNKYLHYITIPAYLFILFLVIINVIIFYALNINFMYLALLSGYYLFLSNYGILKFIGMRKKERDNPNLLRSPLNFYKYTTGKVISIMIYAIVFVYFNISFALKIFESNIEFNFTDTIIYTIYFLGFVILLNLYLINRRRYNANQWLEKLEKEIYLDELKYEEIIARLKREYFGYRINKPTNIKQ